MLPQIIYSHLLSHNYANTVLQKWLAEHQILAFVKIVKIANLVLQLRNKVKMRKSETNKSVSSKSRSRKRKYNRRIASKESKYSRFKFEKSVTHPKYESQKLVTMEDVQSPPE